MTWVKVCGMRTVGDLEAAAEAGADAVGLVLVDGSPRHISVDEAARLCRATTLPAVILTAGAGPDRLVELVRLVGASGVQPYGECSARAARAAGEAGAFVLRPVRVKGPARLADLPGNQTPLLDAYSPDRLGGTGESIPPAWLPPPGTRYVLAGGLDPGNVADAVARYRPWGVDASSGLESSPGVKDPDRIIEFVLNAKGAME